MTLRRALAAVAAFGLLALAAPQCATAAPAQFALQGLGGDVLESRSVAHGVTIVVIWASWSPRCRDLGERVNPLAERWAAKARVVTVNFQEARATAVSFASQQELAVPVYLDSDGEFAKGFGVTNLPGLLVLRDGQPVYSGRFTQESDQVLAESIP